MKHSRLAPSLVLWLFPVVVVALVAGLVVAAIAVASLVGNSVPGRLILQWVAIPLGIAVLVAAREAWKYKPEPADGIEVLPREHPQLWGEVHRLAELAQTEPPARIVIVPEVNAAVTEAAGQREMLIGLPLLATFTRGQLRSVLAHELGHFAGGDTAAATKIMRRAEFLNQVTHRAGALWRWFFSAYAKLYAVAAGPVSREAELRADDLSVRAAGPDVAADAFRAITRADIAWDLTLNNYMPLFEPAGRRAPLGEAMRRLVAANGSEIEPVVDRSLAEQQPSATDSHPPTRERIARFEAAARAGASTPPNPDADAPAVGLLTGGSEWLDAAEGQLLTQDRPLTSWEDVVSHGVRQSIDGASDQFGAFLRRAELGDGGLDNALRLIDDRAGAVETITGETGEEARAHVVDALVNPVLSALLATGAARVEPSWNSPAQLVARDGSALDAEERVAAAIDARDSAPLRAWLAEQGVDVASARADRSAVPQWLSAASHMTGPWDGRCDVHLWTTGILALPLDKATVKQNKDQVSQKHQHPRLFGAAAQGVDAGRSQPDALWWDAEQITSGEIAGKLVKTRIRLDLAGGEAVDMVTTLETAMVDSPESFTDAVGYLTAPKG